MPPAQDQSTQDQSSSSLGFLNGIRSVGTGIVVAGGCTYLFLSLAGRVLGPERFTPVSTLWALVFIVGPGLFLPLQQELGRVVAGVRAQRGGGFAVRRAVVLAGSIGVVATAVTITIRPWMVHTLFGGQDVLFACFVVAIFAYATTFTARGVLSGLGEFADLGRLISYEALARLLVAAALTLAGYRSASAYGIAIAVAPFVSTVIVTRLGRRHRLATDPPVSWRELTRALGWLTIGAFLAQFLANAGPLAIQLLAGHGQAAEAGRFLSALVIARVSLYLFQAVQATILPNLAELAAAGRYDELSAAYHKLVLACVALIVATSVGALVLGPLAVRVLFGPEYDISARTMVVLAGASAVYVLAAALSGTVIALAGHRLNTVGWLLGSLAFMIGTQLADDLFLRVEIAYALGTSVAAATFVIATAQLLRARAPRMRAGVAR